MQLHCSPAEYERLALELARNPTELARIRVTLINKLPSSPLYDAALFAHHIESAYIELYERGQIGLGPDHIYVVDHLTL